MTVSCLARFVYFPRLNRLSRLSYSSRRLLTLSTPIISVPLGPAFDLGSFSGQTFSSSPISLNNAEIESDKASRSNDGGSCYADSDIKRQILETALEFVPTHGWSSEAIVAAADKLGYSAGEHDTFPGDGADLANHFNAKCNSEMRQWLKTRSAFGVEKVEVLLRDAIEQRIRMTLPYKDTWAQAMVELSSPNGVKAASENLEELLDDIWLYSGDREVDFNWHKNMEFLASVYETTESFMLQDESEGHKDTWDFLDRRIEEVTPPKPFDADKYGSTILYGSVVFVVLMTVVFNYMNGSYESAETERGNDASQPPDREKLYKPVIENTP